MANTYTLIASNTLSSSAASVTFSSIPNTYTDLVLRASCRIADASGTNTVDYTKWQVVLNGSSTHSRTNLIGNGATASSERATSEGVLLTIGSTQSDGSTSSTFANFELYIPNYTSTSNKQMSAFGASEQNGTTAFISSGAHLFQTSAAISSLTIYQNFGNAAVGSSFFLYGIKNS